MLQPRIILPRIVVRERSPRVQMPGRRVRLQPQEMRWQLGTYRERVSFGPGGTGRATLWTPTREAVQHNLVLDQTYDTLVAQYGFEAISRYVAVGTGSSAPATAQTGLDAEVARTKAVPSGESDDVLAVSDGVYDVNRVREFTPAQVGNQNLTEWGWSGDAAAGNNLMSRELFRDGAGNPVTITPDVDQYLRLYYTTRITITPVVATPFSIPITNLGTKTGQYMALRQQSSRFKESGSPVDYSDFKLINDLARGNASANTATLYVPYLVAARSALTLAYVQNISTYGGGPLLAGSSNIISTSFAGYVSGSRKRTMNQIVVDISGWNTTIYGWAYAYYQHVYNRAHYYAAAIFALDTGQEFTKDNLHKLVFDPYDAITWGP